MYGLKCKVLSCNSYIALFLITFLITTKYFSLFIDKEKPGMLDFKGKAKWESWNSRKGERLQNNFFHHIIKL